MRRDTFVCLWLVAVALLIFFPVIHADATQATRNRLRELETQREQAGARISDTQNLLQGTHAEMGYLQMTIMQMDQDMLDMLDALDDVEMAILATQIRIYEAEEALAQAREYQSTQHDVLRARLRAMQEHGPMGLLQVLLTSTGFADFFMLWDYVRTVAAFDQQVLERYEQSALHVMTHLDQLDRERNSLDNLFFAQERALRDLEIAIDQRREWFAGLAYDAHSLAILLEIEQEEFRILEADFDMLTVQLAAEVDAIARDRARQQAEERSRQLARLNDFNGVFQWPLPSSARISSPFGYRDHPILHYWRMHRGIDLPSPTGTPIIAAADGYVRFAGWSSGYGNTIIIDHGNNYSTLYAHNSRHRVAQGAFVTRGTHIADVGNTGMSTGPHLHFEIRINNVAVDPMRYFPR